MGEKRFRRIAAAAVAIAAAVATGRAAADSPRSPSAPNSADEQRIAALIRDLDANKFAVRESASEELLRIGEPAVPAIKAALESSASVEVRARAERLVRHIIVWGDMPHELSLPGLMKTVSAISAAKDRAQACRDAKLERLLDCWGRVIGKAGGQDNCPLVRLSDVKLADFKPPGDGVSESRDSLLVVKRGHFGSISRCIILAEGPIQIESAQDCIIVSRSVASVDRCQNTAVFARFLVDTLDASRSILVAGGQVSVDSVGNSIVSGGSDVFARSGRNVVVINPPNGKSHWQDERSQIGACEVRLPEMRLVDAAVKNSLSDRLRLLETLWQGDVVARIRLDGGKEKTLRCGEAVTGADGKPVAGLEHWTLSFANRGLAVFANGEEFATLRVRR